MVSETFLLELTQSFFTGIFPSLQPYSFGRLNSLECGPNWNPSFMINIVHLERINMHIK